MPRRGHSTTIGKFAKLHRDRRVSEIRIFGELLRAEQRPTAPQDPGMPEPRQAQVAR